MKAFTRHSLCILVAALQFCAINAQALTKGDRFDRIQLDGGKYLKNVTIVSVGAKEVTVISDDGVSTVNLSYFKPKTSADKEFAAMAERALKGDPLATQKNIIDPLATKPRGNNKERFPTKIAETPQSNRVKAFGDLYFGESIDVTKRKIKNNGTVEINGHKFTITPKFDKNKLIEISLIGDIGWRPSFHKTTVKEQWETLKEIISAKYGNPKSKRGFFYTFELTPEDTRYTHLWALKDKTIQLGVGQKMEKYGMLDFESSFAHLTISNQIQDTQAVSQVTESASDKF